MPRTYESFDKDLAVMASNPENALHDATHPFRKDGAPVANDFAGQAQVGSLAVDTTTGTLYSCTATDGATTATWVVTGTQA